VGPTMGGRLAGPALFLTTPPPPGWGRGGPDSDEGKKMLKS